MKNDKNNYNKILTYFVLTSLIISTIFVILMIIVSPSKNITSDIIRTKSDYVLILIQCLLGIIAIFLPNILEKKLKLQIPGNMELLYIIFLYCAIFLGEVKNFYFQFSHWDTILHTFSGAMLGTLGFSVVSLMNKTKKWHLNLSPIFVSFFAFCFSITLGVIWEIYEFVFDGLLNLNMQKFALENGKLLIGRLALLDTMKDLIVDAIGAMIISIIGFISLKYKKGWIERLEIRFRK